MKIRKIDFDPPPPPQQHSPYYDVRLNNSVCTTSTDRAFINIDHSNYNGKYLDSSIEEENEVEVEAADNVSLAWSNAPGIEDSPKSQHTEYEEEDDFQYTDTTKLQNRMDTDLTADFDDDDDEDNSVFLNWPELPELPLTSSSQPQHEQLQQRVYGIDGSASSSDRPNWFNWRRRATVPGTVRSISDKDENKDEDITTEIGSVTDVAETKNNNEHDNSDGRVSDNDFLVPSNQQWWQFGRRRTFESYSNNGGRKSSAVESNVTNSGRWRSMELFINNGTDNARRTSNSSDDLDGDCTGLERMNSDSVEEKSEIQKSIKRPIQRRISIDSNNSSFTNRQRSIESNNSSFINRRKSVESKSSSSSVEEEVNEWLFPRRGRRASVTSSEASDQQQNNGDDDVDVIINKFRQSSVNLSPMDRVLLKDMASSKDVNRWQKRPSLLSQDGSSSRSLWDDDNDVLGKLNGEEAKRPPQSLMNSLSRELNESQQGVPEIYWDSEKISKMKGEGVSLARAKAIDEISSLASSDHSGHILRKSRKSQRRLSFTTSIFGWNNSIIDEDADDDGSFRPAQITPRTNPGKLSSMNKSKVTSGKLSSIKTSIRPKSIVISSQSKILLSKSKRRSSIDFDDDDDEEYEISSMKNVQTGQDSRHEAISKEANEVMDSVNNSVLAMGMSAPFRPMDEICPPFQKLHKNLGYQMEALNAAVVRSTKSTSSKKKGMKKSKRIRQSSLTTSFNSGSSSTDNSNQSSTLSLLHDSQALSKYILAQMAMLQSQQTDGSTVNTNNMTPHSFYTSWLPNYMWYQPIAADASSVMRPTSLCTGTGITGDEQYLNPEMLKVFEMFSTYFVGSKHLFQDDDGEEEISEGANMRRSYWMDTIEEIDSDDISSDSSSIPESASDESDMVYELSAVGTDIDQFVDTEKQIEILQTVINDLKKSQLNDRPFVSIKAEPGPESNLSSSTSSNEINNSARGSNLYSSLSSNEINTSNRESNLSASTLTNDII